MTKERLERMVSIYNALEEAINVSLRRVNFDDAEYARVQDALDKQKRIHRIMLKHAGWCYRLVDSSIEDVTLKMIMEVQ